MYLVEGFKLLTDKKILPFVVFPLIINLAIFYFGWSALYQWFDAQLNGWLENIPSWLSFLETILRWMFILAAIIVSAVTFSMLATFIGSPFYGLMAEQVCEIKEVPVPDTPFTANAILRLIGRSLVREVQKLSYYLVRAVPLFVLWLILLFTPISPIMTVVWFLFGAKMLALQYTDYAFDNAGIDFKSSNKALNDNRLTSLTFGGIVQIATMIPLVNILVVPAAVVAGTLYYIDLEE